MARKFNNLYRNNLIELLQNSKNAFCIDGKCYSIPMDNEEEVLWIQFCAERGDANARFQLALCLINGNFFCKNYPEAIKLMEFAAREKADVQFFVALCYTYGILVKKDAEKAVYWYKKAATNGCDEAMCNLGICYLSGFGVERNLETAYDFFIKAAKAPVGVIKKGNGYAKYLCSSYASTKQDRPSASIISNTNTIQTNLLKNAILRNGTSLIKDPITERIEKSGVVYDHDYKSVLEEGWLKFLANQGIVEAQRIYLALYYAGKFHNKQEECKFTDLMNNWRLQNDPYSCLVKAKLIKGIYYRRHYETIDLYNKVPEEKGKEAVDNLIKAVEGGILCAIPTMQGWRNLGCFRIPYNYSSTDAPYWENDQNAPNDERFVKDDEPICFALENEKQICFVEYYCKQQDRIRGIPTRFKSIVFKRVVRKKI